MRVFDNRRRMTFPLPKTAKQNLKMKKQITNLTKIEKDILVNKLDEDRKQ
jgi:hypothetical protein